MSYRIAILVVVSTLLGLAAVAAFEPAPPVAFDQQFGSSASDSGMATALDGSGNAFTLVSAGGGFAGQTWLGGTDMVLRKVNSTGAVQWTRQYGTNQNDQANRALAVTSSGIAATGGKTTGAFSGFTQLGDGDAFVVIHDANGNEVAVDQFGSANLDEVMGIATDDSLFYVVGRTFGALPGQTNQGGTFDYDAFVVIYDLDGAQLDVVQFGTAFDDVANDVTVDASGNSFVTGYTSGLLATPVGGYDGFVAKFDTNLVMQDVAQVGTTSSDFYNAIWIGDGGHLVVAGRTLGAFPGEVPQGNDIAVQRIDPVDLSVLWSRQLGITTNTDQAYDVFVAPDGTSYVTGVTRGLEDRGSAPSNSGGVIALGASGQDIWNDQFRAAGSAVELHGIAVDSQSRVWVTGKTAGNFAPGKVNGNDGITRVYEPFVTAVTEITACGFVANAPGEYRLGADLAGSGRCIEIAADDVRVDLAGFDITVQDGGADFGGEGLYSRLARVDIYNDSVDESVIRVESGIGFDLDASTDAIVDGTIGGIRFDVERPAIVGLSGRSSAGLSIDGARFYNVAGGASTRTAIDLTDATGMSAKSLEFTQDSTSADVETIARFGSGVVEDSQFNNAATIYVNDSWQANTNFYFGGTLRFEDCGDSVDEHFDGASLEILDCPTGLTTFDRMNVRIAANHFKFGDYVRFRNPVIGFDTPGAKLTFTGNVNRSASLINPLLTRNAADRLGVYIDSVNGRSVEAEGTVAVATLNDLTGLSIGQADWNFGASFSLSQLDRDVGFRSPYELRSPAEFATAIDVFMTTFGIPRGTREVLKDGVRITDQCPTLPPTEESVLCPSPATESVYVFGNGWSSGCGTFTLPGQVIVQDADIAGIADQPCLDIQAAMTYVCGSTKITVPANTGVGDSIGARIAAPGVTIDGCEFDLDGADAVGVDAAPGAADATILNVGIRYNFDGGTGIRASDLTGFEISGIRHVTPAVNPPTGLTAYELDNIVDLALDDSAIEGEGQAYVAITAGSGLSSHVLLASVFRGGIELAGLDPSNPLRLSEIIIDGRAYPTERVSFADLVNNESVTIVPIDDQAVENLASAFGPSFFDSQFTLQQGRVEAVLADNLAAPAEFTGDLIFVTEDPDGTEIGSMKFTFPALTAEAGIQGSWDMIDNDSADFGPDFDLEQMVKVVFNLIGAPADPALVEAFLAGPDTDPIADGDCTVAPVPEGDPVEIECTWPVVIGNPLHVRVCGDGIINAEFPGDDCDPPGSGMCQVGCIVPPPADTLVVDMNVDLQAGEIVLTWGDNGGGPFEVYRSTDRGNVVDPSNLVETVTGTEWRGPLNSQTQEFFQVIPTN